MIVHISYCVKKHPILDLKRRLQSPHRSIVGGMENSEFSLGYRQIFYLSSSFFEGYFFFFLLTALLQLVLPATSVSQSIIVLSKMILNLPLNRRRWVPRSILIDARSEKMMCLGRHSVKGSGPLKSMVGHGGS